MTRDEEVIRIFEAKAGALLAKAQQFLTTVLPGGPGAFVYVVAANLVGKLFGNTREYVEKAVNRPITLPDFIYVEPLEEELQEFFADARLKSIRAEFPAQSEDFTDQHWATLRRYYMPLYYTLTLKEPFVTQMFAVELRKQNYQQIIKDFALFPLYKKTIQSIPSAARQNALWSAVSAVLKETVQEVWSKDYAKQLFGQAKAQPDIATLIGNIKAKIGITTNIAQLFERNEASTYAAGRSISPEGQTVGEFPLQALEYVTKIAADGRLPVPVEVARKLHLRPNATVRVLILCDG